MANNDLQSQLEQLIVYHDTTMLSLIQAVKDNEHLPQREKGGLLRSTKGELVEELARRLVRISWTTNLNQSAGRLSINKTKIPIHVRGEYLKKLTPVEVRKYWEDHMDSMVYGFGTDLHVYIDGKFVIPIECKAYTENAMIKRILVDAQLLKEALGIDFYYLLQLESMLGGDYHELNDVVYGSKSTHTLASHFDVNLRIITLLAGERKVDEATHTEGYLKNLPLKSLQKAVESLSEGMIEHCKKN